ncbi:hypothetical protein M758_11G039000 [Ceratodon purpureus]|nr:hypothetical protein M758_11G039000 [Ceratodon purpureus]
MRVSGVACWVGALGDRGRGCNGGDLALLRLRFWILELGGVFCELFGSVWSLLLSVDSCRVNSSSSRFGW